VVDAYIKGYFDNIPHDRLLARVKERVIDSRVLALLGQYLQQEVMDGLEQWTPEMGTPQGAVISPLLANIYLNPLDHLMAEHGYEMVRYADDFVILCRTGEEAQAALALAAQWMQENGLTLHPDKTRIVDGNREGFDFLGYHFHYRRNKKWPSRRSTGKLKDAVRAKTKRTSGHSLSRIIADLNPLLRGWFAYFKHTSREDMAHADGYVRDRLRAVLRKRSKRRGRASANDRMNWTNAYFQQHGLFCLELAYVVNRQSLRR
jgi:RNA-directed DNA polymerase